MTRLRRCFFVYTASRLAGIVAAATGVVFVYRGQMPSGAGVVLGSLLLLTSIGDAAQLAAMEELTK